MCPGTFQLKHSIAEDSEKVNHLLKTENKILWIIFKTKRAESPAGEKRGVRAACFFAPGGMARRFFQYTVPAALQMGRFNELTKQVTER
jgi:hypothetical protein